MVSFSFPVCQQKKRFVEQFFCFFSLQILVGLMTRHNTELDTFYCTQLDCLMEIVEKWPNADYYIPKFRRLRPHLLEKGAATFQPDPNHFNTLIQGDLCVDLFLSHKT